MAIKLIFWAFISAGITWALSILLPPQGTLHWMVIFALPFAALGFQERVYTAESKWSLLGFEFFTSSTTYKQLTFWGVPIGSPTEVHGERQLLTGVARLWPKLLDAPLSPREISGGS